MMRSAKWLRTVCGLAALVAVSLAMQSVCVAKEGERGEKAVSVNVVQVQASNKGQDYIDPELGDLGKRLKSKYPYKSFKKVGSQSSRGAMGQSLNYPLVGGMSLTLELVSATHDVLTTKAAVMRGAQEIVKTSLRVGYRQPVLISVPLEEDLLILAITPSGGGD